MPKPQTVSWISEEERKRSGNYKIGDLVAQDYKMRMFHFRSYIPDAEIGRFLTEEQQAGLKKAPKILCIIAIGEDGMAIGIHYKENVNNDDDWHPWGAFEQHSKIEGGE